MLIYFLLTFAPDKKFIEFSVGTDVDVCALRVFQRLPYFNVIKCVRTLCVYICAFTSVALFLYLFSNWPRAYKCIALK